VWVTYNGTALAAGWWLGLPRDARDSVIFLAAQPTATSVECWSYYIAAAAVIGLDRATRRWVLPLAWLCRIPAASLVLGAALYGVQTPISELYP
jgi:hypothetical protein